VGAKLARPGMKFLHGTPNKICKSCKYYRVCMGNLEPGRVYEVVRVRPIKHECPLHEGGVIVVEVKEAEVYALIYRRLAIEGAIITYHPIFCENPCSLSNLCVPLGLKDGDKCKIIKVLEKVDCPLGKPLSKCLLLRVQ